MATMNISLPDDLKSFVDAQLTGRYSTSSEYVRELIRRERDRLAAEPFPKGGSRDRWKYTHSDIHEPDAGAEGALSFSLFLDDREIPVVVGRKAMDEYAEKVGVPIRNLAHGYVEFLKTYQPEFAWAAVQRLRSIDTVAIVSADGVEF